MCACMHEKIEHLTLKFAYQGIPFPHEAEGGIEKSANVQALHAKAEGQVFVEVARWSGDSGGR